MKEDSDLSDVILEDDPKEEVSKGKLPLTLTLPNKRRG